MKCRRNSDEHFSPFLEYLHFLHVAFIIIFNYLFICFSDKIIVGSFHGVLRIYCPKPPHFKPDDLMLEVQLQQPILQVEAGRFVS